MTAAQALDVPSRGRLVGQRITVVEDHALLAQSLRFSLTAEGADVHVVDLADAGDVEHVVADCVSHRPYVVLLDLDLGVVGDGAVMIAALVNSGSRVIVLTGSVDRVRLGGCLEAGATGLIEKTENLDFLVEQVRRAGVGEPLLRAQRRLDLVNESRHQRANCRTRLAPFSDLTQRESEVLRELVRGHQVDQICRELYVSEATARTHVRGILRKLDVRSQLAAVALAREVGWEPPAGTPGLP